MRSEQSPGQPNWTDLVDRIRHDESSALEELYRIFSKGMRYYLHRQLGPQDLDDRVHDCFLIVAQAIRRGELRDPERLLGFARTIVRRQIAEHISLAVQQRKQQVDMDLGVPLSDSRLSPEASAIRNEQEQLALSSLKGISKRARAFDSLLLEGAVAGTDLLRNEPLRNSVPGLQVTRESQIWGTRPTPLVWLRTKGSPRLFARGLISARIRME
jgi:DNA-directed RNA polymerase specialized sigma24 family protein